MPVCSATIPAAATTPACRIEPPSSLRARRALVTNSALPASSPPTGALSPLLRQTETESAGPDSSATLTPSATAALKIRAPSTCRCSPCSSHSARSPAIVATSVTVPPARLCVFSTHTMEVGG